MEFLKFNYTLSNSQSLELKAILAKLTNDPYVQTVDFKNEIKDIISAKKIPEWFIQICDDWNSKDKMEYPEFLLKNAPVDDSLPILSYNQPVKGKYRLKKEFISEGFLELFAQLCHQESIGYKFVNTGDIYQDIHPMKRLSQTQSQKSITNLGFHKDLANHFVRPDFVNIIGLRSYTKNKVYTTFVRNIDLLKEFDKLKIADILKEDIFFTPYDALTKDGDKSNELDRAKNHSVIYDELNISFFEGRTEGTTEAAQRAVKLVEKALHRLKRAIFIQAGDFISSENNKCIHGKEIAEVTNEDRLKERWLMKTVNLYPDNLEKYQDFFIEDRKYIVNG